MKAITVRNLFGENDYRCGRMAPYVITIGKTNYMSLDDVKHLGFIYELEDIEEIEYPSKTKQSIESTKAIEAVSFENIFGDNDHDSEYNYLAIEKDGIRYLSMDNLKKTSLVIKLCDIEEVEI